MSAGLCLWSLPGRAVALWGHAALVPGQFLIAGGAAAFAGRSCPPVGFPGHSRAARSPFGVMPRWSRDNFCLPQAARSPWLVALRTPFGAISCLWEVLGRSGSALASTPAGNFCWGGGDAGLPLRAPMSPHICVQAGFDPPAKLACWGTLVSGVGLGPGLHFRPVPRVCPGGHCTPFGGPARHLKHKNNPLPHPTTLLEIGFRAK